MPVIQFTLPEADYYDAVQFARAGAFPSTNILGKAIMLHWLRRRHTDNPNVASTDELIYELERESEF